MFLPEETRSSNIGFGSVFQLFYFFFFYLFVAQVIEGYESACKKALEILPDCVCSSAKDLHDVDEAASLIRTAVTSKQYGNEDFLSNLIAQACGESAID